MSDAETLVMLVGGNPLPNYIVAMHFKPAEIILVHTVETKKVAENLERVFKDGDGLGKQLDVHLRELETPKDPSSIRRFAKEILKMENVRLDYTGGTKLMATQFRLAFQELKEDRSNKISTYLDGYTNEILFDTGHLEILKDATENALNMRKLAIIHGLEVIREKKESPIQNILNKKKANDFAEIIIPIEGPNSYEERKRISDRFYEVFIEDNDSLEICADKIDKDIKIPEEIRAFTRENIYEIIDKKLSEKKTKKFFTGNWLELFCQNCISKIFEKDESPTTVFVSKKYTLEGRPFEIDVSFVRKLRYFQVSCTTDSSLGGTKTKLFETYVRTRQVGGDLARTALVCFCNRNDISDLNRDAGLVWDDPSKPTVFGLEDLKAWVKGDVSRLREWCKPKGE